MTPLRRAAIAFRELLSDYVPTEIVDILHDHHYLTRDTVFLARCYSKLELEELGKIEKVIESFFEEVANESILEENLTDWQREIITAINQVIDNSIFSGLFSVRNTLTAYDDIEIAMIRIIACNNKDVLRDVIKYFYQFNQTSVSLREMRIFLSKILQGDLKEGALSSWQQNIIEEINKSSFLIIFNLNYLDIYSVLSDEPKDDESDIESLLSHDETLIGDETIVGPSFNIPYKEKFIQGNRIHKELASVENAYKRIFYQKRGEEAKQEGSPDIERRYKQYSECEIEIQETIEEIQQNRNISIEDREGLFWLLSDKRSLDIQFREVQERKDSQLKDQWKDKAAYPNLATAKVSYIGQDGKLHIKSIKTSQLAKSKAVKAYIKQGGTHSEGQVFEYVKELVESDTKYKKSKKIVIDVHTKMDMCAVKSIGDYYNRDYIIEGTCTKLACDLTTKYPKITIRVSYDIHHYYGQKSYNYLCQPCKSADSWVYKILPTTSMLQHPIGEDFEYFREEMDLEEILGSTGGNRYTSTVEKAKKAHYQHVIDRFLADENLHTVEAGAGGNCFFHAIARQLEIINNDEEVMNYEELRQFAIQYMIDHPEEFIGFTEDTLDDYIDQMSQNGTWADNPIIQALANEFQFEILIYRINGEINIIRGDNPVRTVSVAYTGAHYLSVEVNDQEQDENIERLVQAMGESAIADQETSDNQVPSSIPTKMPSLSPAFAPTAENGLSHTDNFTSESYTAQHSGLNTFAIFLGVSSVINHIE